MKCVADRILSVAWHEPENVIVTGGVDCIRVWSVHSGQAVVRLDTGRVAAQVHTYVHALCVTEYVELFLQKLQYCNVVCCCYELQFYFKNVWQLIDDHQQFVHFTRCLLGL